MRKPCSLLLLASGCGEPAPIADALATICPQRPPREADGDLALATLEAPGAVCNDGSPAALYVGAATDPAHRDDWVVYLEAGGGCVDARSCSARWCASVSRMSSDYLSSRQMGLGILSTDPTNSFAGWNHVSVHYCSSDFWTGDNDDPVTLRGIVPYTLLFRGHRIIEGAVTQLEAGVVSDDGSVVLPSLSEAQLVVFAGASAGGRGVGMNLDWLAERLPETSVVGLMDGFAGTAQAAMRDAVADSFVAGQTSEWLRVYVDMYDAFADRDCPKSYECIDAWFIQSEQLDTPFVVRRDLYDPLIAELFAEYGSSVEETAADLSESMNLLAELRPERAAIFGPSCGDHIITAAPEFGTQAVIDAERGGEPRTLDDLTRELALGGKPQVVVDTPDARTSLCD